MNFEILAKCFRHHADIESIPELEREMFSAVLLKIHLAGFDWYVAENTCCFGIRDVKSGRAEIRLGRITPDHLFIVNTASKRNSALLEQVGDALSQSSVKINDKGHFFFTASSFLKLLEGTDFLAALKKIAPTSQRLGSWPIDELYGESHHVVSLVAEINLEYENYAQDLNRRIDDASADSVEARRARLRVAAKLPTRRVLVRAEFERNPDVVAEVLYLARGVCGNPNCRKPAPFNRRRDGKPYLEVHHRVLLSEGGEDTVENAVALCPNCHRETHFG